MNRQHALDRFYELLAQLTDQVGGPRRIGQCTAKDGWPPHGVYFIFEPGELRADGVTPRVVRVGTHALTATSATTLWNRIRTHRGTVRNAQPGGNHRGSIFRLHVGTALTNCYNHHPTAATSWANGSTAPRDIRDRETALEADVSRHIAQMSIVALAIPDRHDRALVERGSIALLSNHHRSAVDPPSPNWLGNHADRTAVRESGLWNVNHVNEIPTAAAITAIERYITSVGPSPRHG